MCSFNGVSVTGIFVGGDRFQFRAFHHVPGFFAVKRVKLWSTLLFGRFDQLKVPNLDFYRFDSLHMWVLHMACWVS